jgi:hypothetical protein
MQHRAILALVLGGLFVAQADAQQFVYPAKGQSPEQQAVDEAQCHAWAVGQTGFDPAKMPPGPVAAGPPTTATGVTPGAGVGGAVKGAIVGGIVDGDDGAATGAVAGAVIGRSRSRGRNAAQDQAAQQAQVAAQQQQMEAFGKARSACLEGRGYTVK